MEHLPLPKDVLSPGPGPVPYVCREAYDGGPFLTYPVRKKEFNALANETGIFNTDINGVISKPIAELEAFIQTWLFFGLLTEVFGDLFTTSQYVVTPTSTSGPRNGLTTGPILMFLKKLLVGGPRQVMNTNSLVPTVEIWMKLIESSKDPEDEQRRQYEHLAACLRLTSNALQAVRPSMRADFNPWVRRSIASVGELLSLATNKAFGIEKGSRCPGNWRLLYDDPQCIIQMKDNGHCPYEIHRTRTLFNTIQAQHLWAWSRKESSGTRHENCTERECRANHSNLGQYIAKHHHDTCQCKSLEIDLSEVIRILSQSSLPLIRIISTSTLNDLRVEVVEASPNLKFVALSHVWADGLGNPQANSLPRCQLQLLSELLRPFSEIEDGREILFWIDTLCCPVGPPEAKTMALNTMKKPYTDATHVLVLDSSLRNVEISCLNPTEVCLRIFTSGWMRRLWTLQEGALPRNLWFQFKGSVIELRQVWLKVINIYDADISRRGLALDMTVLYRGLRHFFYAEEGDPGVDLESIDQTLQFRSVSVAADEPLLIGGLLSLDTAYILDGPEDSRMQRLWSLMPLAPRGILTNILFNRGSRLPQPGFRWAPASLLAVKGPQDGLLRSTDVNDSAIGLTPAGLHVCLAAFPIKIASAPIGLPRNPWNMFNEMDQDSILCRDGNAVWFLIYRKYGISKEVERVGKPRSLHNILKSNTRPQTLLLASAFNFDGDPSSKKSINGLLVHDNGNSDGTSMVVSDIIVEMGMQEGTSKTLLEAAYQASRTLHSDEITTEYTDLAIEDEKDQKDHPAYQKLEPILAQKLFDLAESIDDQNVLDAIKAHNSAGTKTFFPVRTASAYLGCYCDLGPMLPSDTEWYVD